MHPLLKVLPLVRAIAQRNGARAEVQRVLSQPSKILVTLGDHEIEIELDGDLAKHRDATGLWVELDDGTELELLLRDLREANNNTIITETDRCNVSESQGWHQEADGTWSALTRARSKSGFKTERGARAWFMRHASPSTLAKMGLD